MGEGGWGVLLRNACMLRALNSQVMDGNNVVVVFSLIPTDAVGKLTECSFSLDSGRGGGWRRQASGY